MKGTEPSKKCGGGKTVEICSESGKLATEYCPKTKKRTYSIKPETEENGNWDSQYGNLYSDPPTKECDIHTEETQRENNTSNSNNTTSGENGNTTDNTTTPEEPEEPEEPEKPEEPDNPGGSDKPGGSGRNLENN